MAKFKNSGVAKLVETLNNLGYRYVTFGWDSVQNSLYYKYRNESQSFDGEGKFVLPEILEGDDLPDFYYAREVNEGDVFNLAQYGKIEELLKV